MFEDSLIESGGKLKTKRGWTSILSFLLQFRIIGVMVLIPLIFTEALPKTATYDSWWHHHLRHRLRLRLQHQSK